jgi:hypothetical protein
MVFTSLERREIFRDAVFLWITPFFAALSIIDFAILSSSGAASLDFSLTVNRTRLFSFWRARFIADL